MSKDSKIGLKKFPPKDPGPTIAADDHVYEDELAISAAVYSDPADELVEMRERYAELVRAAEQAMRQRNALWLIAAEYAPVRAGVIVPLIDVQRSCDAIGPLFVPAWRVVPEAATAPTPREQLRASLEANSARVAEWPAEVRAAISIKDVFDAPAPTEEPVSATHQWDLPDGWSWVVDEYGDWSAESPSAVVSWAANGVTWSKLGAPDEVHELVRRRNLTKGGVR